MMNRTISGRTGLAALLCLILIPAFGPSPAAAYDNGIHLIPAPKTIRDPQGGYTFAVFGDTRTAANDDAPEDRAFHKIRNLTHANVEHDLTKEDVSFALYTGDFIWHGSALNYWQEIRAQFPASLRSPASPRLFPVLGNHELWQVAGEGDAMANYFGTFPYLVNEGEQHEQLHNYAYVIGDSLYVNLCSGGYDNRRKEFDRDDRTWTCKLIESFPRLMESLTSLYHQQAADGRPVKSLFLTYHKPSYSTYKHPPLAADNDPVPTLRVLKEQNPGLKIFVFNGHNHVTELFEPAPGLFTLVAGGGGAPQQAGVPIDDHGKPMPERFWPAVGSSRERRVNYFLVHVGEDGGEVTVEEQVLCANDDVAVVNYLKGVHIDKTGHISYTRPSRKWECRVDDYLYVFE